MILIISIPGTQIGLIVGFFIKGVTSFLISCPFVKYEFVWFWCIHTHVLLKFLLVLADESLIYSWLNFVTPSVLKRGVSVISHYPVYRSVMVI